MIASVLSSFPSYGVCTLSTNRPSSCFLSRSFWVSAGDKSLYAGVHATAVTNTKIANNKIEMLRMHAFLSFLYKSITLSNFCCVRRVSPNSQKFSDKIYIHTVRIRGI